MITSIVLTGRHSIYLDRYSKFKYEDYRLSIKDIPYVRYRFNAYGDAEIEYIKNLKSKFIYSIHLVEVCLSEDTKDILNKIDKNLENVVVYVYIPINDEVVSNGFSDKELDNINSIYNLPFERVMLKDNSTTLDNLTALDLKERVSSILRVPEEDIGICSSPLSFDNRNACLTALKARELAALYADNDNIALPTANHQCMNNCGCIRYLIINKDTIKLDGSSNKNKNKNIAKSNKDSKKKHKKKIKGILKW